MSWNPFARQVKKPIVSKAEERAFERECSKLQNLEDCSKKVYKDSKKAVQANETFVKAGIKLRTDLRTATTSQGQQPAKCLEVALKAEQKQLQKRGALLQKCMVDSSKKYLTVFPYCNTQIKARDKTLQECNKLQAKVEKYEEREHTASNSIKIIQANKELKPVKAEFEKKNDALMTDMPKFYDDRILWFHPSLETMVLSEYVLHSDTAKTYEKSLEEMSANTIEENEAEVRKILDQVRQLSITTDD